MKITVLGSGAMGSLFSAYLSKDNAVTLVGTNASTIEAISKNGITVNEKDGSCEVYTPNAVSDTSSMPHQDLVILFVKSMASGAALEQNKNLIGPETYLMTLQNGSGHEKLLLRYADRAHVIIGTTQHNSSVVKPSVIRHGGTGITCIGMLDGANEALKRIAEVFNKAGFECRAEENVLKTVWKKLFTNTSVSALTALFQVPQGFIHSDPNANFLMRQLCMEAVTVANSLGLGFDPDEVLKDVDAVGKNFPDGLTSIYADIRDGRKTEVDTISGSVVAAAHEKGIPVPYHEMLVKAIHALENKNAK